ncbi:MAG: hypothetical protein M3Y23_06375 [Actinomycetota bacterium]|nr:hypothetical protein [Actinomycetota bacterium]
MALVGRNLYVVAAATAAALALPLSALPAKNDFIKTLVPFLRKQIR